MVYGGRPSTGCFLCLKRKIRCDEVHPSCQNCLVYGRPCPGYRPKIIFIDETQKVKQLVKKVSNSPSSSQLNDHDPSAPGGSPEPPLMLCRLPDSTWEERAVCYFFDQYTTSKQPRYDEAFLPSLPSLYALSRENKQEGPASSSLRLAVDATALLALSNEAKAPLLNVKASRLYAMALQELRQSLASRAEVSKNETLATVILLCIFEDMNGEQNRSFNSHTRGLETLINLRRNRKLALQHWDLFTFACVYAGLEVMALGNKPYFDINWLLSTLDKSNPRAQLIVIGSKVFQIARETSSKWSVKEDIIPAQLAAWIKRSKLIDLELVKWSQGLPNYWLPLIVYSPTGETLMTYGGIGLAVHWNSFRILRIYLQRLMRDLRQTIASIVSDSNMYDSILQQEDVREQEVIQAMIIDVCQSIPYTMGKIDDLGNPITPLLEGLHIRGFQAYGLLGSLRYILSSGEATQEQRCQILTVLDWLGSARGIKLASRLAGECSARDTVPPFVQNVKHDH